MSNKLGNVKLVSALLETTESAVDDATVPPLIATKFVKSIVWRALLLLMEMPSPAAVMLVRLEKRNSCNAVLLLTAIPTPVPVLMFARLWNNCQLHECKYAMPCSTHPFSHSVIQSFNHSSIQSFNHSVIQSFSHSSIQSFNHSVIRPPREIKRDELNVVRHEDTTA